MSLIGRMATTIVGTRIAAETGKAGFAGVAVGMVATRIISRSPMGALFVGGAYLAHQVIKKMREIDAKGPHKAAVDDGLIEAGDHSAQVKAAPLVH